MRWTGGSSGATVRPAAGDGADGTRVASESYDPSYYEVLGVPEDASARTVGRAFMRAMRDAHPDAHAGDDADARAAAEQQARLFTEAHGVLTGPDRAGYDARLASWRGTAHVVADEPVVPPGPGGEDEPVLPVGVPDETVLPLSRERWLRGGRLSPVLGGSPIDVPARVGPDEVLVYEGRGAPGPDGHPGDLHVRVVHVDRHGAELPGGHQVGSGVGAVGDLVRRMSPGDAALLALGLLVALAAVVLLVR